MEDTIVDRQMTDNAQNMRDNANRLNRVYICHPPHSRGVPIAHTRSCRGVVSLSCTETYHLGLPTLFGLAASKNCGASSASHWGSIASTL